MTRLIDPHLANLSEMMKQMCDLSIRCTNLAIDAYLGGQNARKEVHDFSNQMMDLYDKVGELTFEIILRYQPVASDFRLVRSSLEISYGFTRLGRYAYDITLVRDTFGDLSDCKNEAVYTLSGEIKQMVRLAVECFATLDLEKAKELRTDEDLVDKYYNKHLPMLITLNNVKCALADALVLRYMERMADHAAFVGDSVGYIVTGARTYR
ncbi:phosphate signaling complex PhoU family protein [Candidatus Nitrosotalea okcheonensis]|uniref:Phosphate uptake regulator n=1 Tax=Candidatus Nitrosotalea okcheonensis TaxID=1903276 RepID=A0A2H1FBY9_9ARCH|nr:PhoU domain-containing protein [Candidatus Nitrosotalea okcheonensis]MDE1728829.1 phosphate uptake regulator PhoU [Nitrososphaerota archaeon]MDE1831119.1 phosphate uptake regulator PhoU [Nitrososphaerota archaeon]MDE1841238.1 phosphate uptake regulator PhoU [Nitrososphaerota archaeon]MDE1877312.1 phosphate uptake regulator PhoU [Nitrososphaerota archaeon]SMH70283.1 Phosphate uptake regulator [Candidatus Nitrosotalea okcheonensis]